MRNTAPRRHQVDLAGPDHLDIAQAVAVQHFTLYHPGECLQADVRMRPHAHSGPWFEYGGTGMIEKAPGADGALLARWQDAIHCNAAADFGVARRDADKDRKSTRLNSSH